ncbi:MAG TPA: hypothetical protein VFT45_26440 [Longimicrobium sp.]|nr:hypothetical protein [Longimicrobium sp.]
MHSVAPPEKKLVLRSRLRRFATLLVLAVAGVLTGSARLAAQAAASVPVSDAPPAVVSAVSPPPRWAPPPAALPLILTPPTLGADYPVSVQDGPGMVPVLFAIFGGIAGMFVGDWWMQRNCKESCEESGFYGMLAGGMLGGIIGYLIGGGEIPDHSPPGRWP